MRQHIVTIRSDIVRGRCESGDDEEHQSQPEHTDRRTLLRHRGRIGIRQSERQEDTKSGHQHLHGNNPPTLGFDHIDQRTPNPFQEPREIKQCGEECQLVVGHSHFGKE